MGSDMIRSRGNEGQVLVSIRCRFKGGYRSRFVDRGRSGSRFRDRVGLDGRDTSMGRVG